VKPSQVRLLVDDFPACFRFLRDSLGLECTFGGVEDGYASFAASAGTVAVVRRDDQGNVVELRAPGDSVLGVLEVEDVESEAQRLSEYVIGSPVSKAAWGGRVAYLRDPDGNLFEPLRSIRIEAQ
jgi:lactoylglutathione lyase